MNIVRRQHYVWKHYLDAWALGGRINVARSDGTVFATNPNNVAVQRDFYEIPYLTEDDERFLQEFIDHIHGNPALHSMACRWLDNYAAPSRLRRVLERKGIPNSEYETEIKSAEIQLEEQLHSRIEGDSKALLDELRQGNSAIWLDDSNALQLSFFLSVQHFRTKRVKVATERSFRSASERERFIRCWPTLRIIFATNTGWSIFSERRNWRLRTLEVAGNLRFITADQPSHNLTPGNDRFDLAFYYPVSPDRAMLLEPDCRPSSIGSESILSDDLVDRLNQKVLKQAHEQIFGINAEYLTKLAVPGWNWP